MEKLGATGNFPNGKLNEDDDGELNLGIAIDESKNVIIVAFGKPITWLGMSAAQAEGLAAVLKNKAAELQKINMEFQFGKYGKTNN